MSCPVSPDEVFQSNPVAVALTTRPCDPPSFLLKLHTEADNSNLRKVNMTLCLSGPLKFGYADVGQFVQWMEFNKRMGVERFVLYNHSVDASLRPYLEYYAMKGDLSLLSGAHPDSIHNPVAHMKNFGHLALINDCLYRNMHVTQRIVYMDVDELIVPRTAKIDNWADLVAAGHCTSKPQGIVRNVFFPREWPSDEHFSQNETVSKLGLLALLKTKRHRKIWLPFKRSKYFVQPKMVEISSVHNVYRFMSGKEGCSMDETCVVRRKHALLQHYRYWGKADKSHVIDLRMHNYADFLVSRVQAVHEHVLRHKVSYTTNQQNTDGIRVGYLDSEAPRSS